MVWTRASNGQSKNTKNYSTGKNRLQNKKRKTPEKMGARVLGTRGRKPQTDEIGMDTSRCGSQGCSAGGLGICVFLYFA